ncbi:MAG: FkbM family methyltransferase [Phycisphaerales bacterium]
MPEPVTHIPDMTDVRPGAISRAGARIDHLYHALVRRRFAGVVRQLGRHVEPGGVILDVGANHGRYTKHLAALHHGSCRVYAFEPLEYNLKMLRLVVGRRPNVTIIEKGLSNAPGEVELYVPYKKASRRYSHGSAHMSDANSPDSLGTRTAPDVCKTTIQTVRLDDWAAAEGLDRFDLMKIDVEGAEPLVIEGALATLDRFHPAIFAELIPGMPERVGRCVEDVIDPLRRLGYRMFAADTGLNAPREVDAWTPDARDYLFLSPAVA